MHEKSVALLNQALGEELTAINQYMYFHFRCSDMGLDPLAQLFKRVAIEEMRHAERLAERILFLNGEVEMKPSAPVEKLSKPEQMLELAAKLEEQSVRSYNQWAKECTLEADASSKGLFESLVADEERHFDIFDTELENLRTYGPNYLALQSIERIKKGDNAAS